MSAYGPMRDRVRETVSAARAGDWDRLLTYRLGAWKSALAMTREKPLLGYGPGTFGAEFVPHRLSVEIASRRRYENPMRTSTYAEAHCDYLQSFAEAGIPGGLAGLGAALFLFLALARFAGGARGEARAEAVFLLALLGAGAAAALTWFPMQRPISALPLLLAAGRAWRLSGGKAQPEGAPS
jgi:O-antigen ligase